LAFIIYPMNLHLILFNIHFEYKYVIKLIVFITFLYQFFALRWKNEIHRKLILILWISFLCEAVTTFLILEKESSALVVTIYSILNSVLWLLLLFDIFKVGTKVKNSFILLYLLFSVSNLIIVGTKVFNYQTFVVGAFIYLFLFVYYSFTALRNENLNFFNTNRFLLITAPLLFFIGLSIVFCFKSKVLTSYYIFENVKLYTFINSLVNSVYYILINVYIFKESKIKYD
jgi:hypothetical protein